VYEQLFHERSKALCDHCSTLHCTSSMHFTLLIVPEFNRLELNSLRTAAEKTQSGRTAAFGHVVQ